MSHSSVASSPLAGLNLSSDDGTVQVEMTPGSDQPTTSKAQHALLDDPREWPAFGRLLSTPSATECWESHLVVEGMHCAACALTVEDALRAVPGVQEVTVSAGSRRARLVWSAEQTRPSQWWRAVERAGYRLVPANDAFANMRRSHETRRALWRWLVAGLCMMQVMMYAWPAYVAQPGDLSDDMGQLLRWASWVLSLPVLLFSCGPFFASAWRDIRHLRVSMDLPVTLGIVITFAISTVGTFDPQSVFGREVYFDSFTMFVFFLLTGRWLELRLRDRTAGSLDALMNRLPDSVLRCGESGEFERVAVSYLRPDDVIRVLPGEAFPADGVILEGRTQADEALLTGESRPVLRTVGDPVIAGSYNLAAAVRVRVMQVGRHTRFAEIVGMMESAATSKPQLAQLADRVAKPFLLVVLLAAGAAAAFWWPHDPAHALMVAVAVLVVTCPCALSLATPTAMLAAAGALARRGVLVRRLQALEALANIDVFVFDKTGTLTHDALVLKDIRVRAGLTPDQALTMAAGLARHSLHPISRALVDVAHRRGLSVVNVRHVTESAGFGLSAQVDQGSTVQVLKLGSAVHCSLNDLSPSPLPQVHLSDGQGWLASFEFSEGLRSDAMATLAEIGALGLEIALWSGDTAPAVQRVASQAGIASAHGACTPNDKLRLLKQLQQAGKKVAMVGDGINDGPVLAGANVSFAVGRALPLTRSQADFVLQGDQLIEIVRTLKLARLTMRRVMQNLGWAAGYNAICVPLAIMGWLPAWLAGLGMALSSLLVVLNALRLTHPAVIHHESNS